MISECRGGHGVREVRSHEENVQRRTKRKKRLKFMRSVCRGGQRGRGGEKS